MRKTLILKPTQQFLEQSLLQIKEELKITAIEIGEAASHGDLKENAEFEAAKEKEHILLIKQKRLLDTQSQPVFIELPVNPTSVSFGTYVEVFDTTRQTNIRGVVAGVAEMETSMFNIQCISYHSPLCAAILGKGVGDESIFSMGGKSTKLIVKKIESCQAYIVQTPKLLIFGNLGRDEIYHDGQLQNSFIAGSCFYALAGAVGISKSIAPVASIGSKDAEIFETITQLGVITHGIQKVSNVESPKFQLFYDTAFTIRDLGRTVTEHLGAGKYFSFNSISNNLLGATHAFVGCSEPAQQLECIVNLRAKSQTIQMIGADSVDHHIKQQKATVMKVFENADIVFINERQQSIINDLTRLDKYIVKKMGASGAELWMGNKCIAKASAPTVTCIDATGSGDVLAGAFMAFLAMGKSFSEALSESVNRASQSISQFGIKHILK